MKTVTVLGCTGSIGTQTIELLAADPESFRVVALVGGRNVALLAQQALKWRPELVVIADEASHDELKQRLKGSGIATAAGAAAGRAADWISR